ncbi:MAG: M13 family metallopeptidase N-terminal domain-containing protein, partial [Candidatus Velthaea sp.]
PACKPCDDFARFATGGWEKTHRIPAGHASWGIADEILDSNRAILRGILEDAAKNTAAPAGSDRA